MNQLAHKRILHLMAYPTWVICLALPQAARATDDLGKVNNYRAYALGQFSPLLSRHPVYLALGATDSARRVAYRRLFRPPLDPETLSNLRLALNQSQPLGNERFYAKIERITGQRREARSRGGRG